MKERNRTARNWKYAFEKDFSETEANGRHLKTGLSQKQKGFIREMWSLVTGSFHCIFPTYRGDKMVECGEENNVELHHVYPQGASKRLNEDPDNPRNIVPLCSEHHRKGQRGKDLTRVEQDVVHLDSAWANRQYSDDKQTYHKVQEQRTRQLDEGEEYWVPFWDKWFRQKADDVVNKYHARNDGSIYPSNKNQERHINWVWSRDIGEWEEG